MKEEMIELLELMIDIAMATQKQTNNETENICQSQQSTPAIPPTNSVPPVLKTKLADAEKQLQKKILQ